MASPSFQCAEVDNTFGPHALNCRGNFDFTLLFEESILSLLPTCIILFAAFPRVWHLIKRATKVEKSVLLYLKLASFVALSGLQLGILILWLKPSSLRTKTSVPAAAVGIVACLALCLLSYAEHVRSVRPSFLLNIFLFVTLPFDIARTRTLWLRSAYTSNRDLAVVSTTAVSLKALLLVLEALNKRRWLNPEYKTYPAEAISGIYNRYFFWWLNPLFRMGFFKTLSMQDLFTLDNRLKAAHLNAQFHAAWATVMKKTSSSLLKTSIVTLKWPLLQVVPPRVALSALNFCQPFLINRAITLSQQAIDKTTTQIGYGLIAAYILVYVGIAVSTGQYQHSTYRAITMVRGGLISMIYRKTAYLSLKDADPASSLTLMSADIERIVQGWQTMHEIWANAFEIALAIYLLERQLGVACVVPIVVAIFSLVGSTVAMSFIVSRQAMWLEAIEKRISATSAMLSSMKGVKMCGLKQTLMTNLHNLRVEELQISKKFRRLLIWNMVFAYVTQVFAPVLTFAIFSVIARSKGGSTTLDTARVFTSLSLFTLLADPLASLVMSLATFMGAVGSFTRIQDFLEKEERADSRKSRLDFDDDFTEMATPSLNTAEKRSMSTERSSAPAPSLKSASSFYVSRDAITIVDGSFGWSLDKEPLLKGITLAVPRHKLTVVVGPVGCGKSTLLKAILGEVPTIGGTVKLASMSIAYCDQTPWHMNGTIQQAIVGMSTLDHKWYARVMEACALREDLSQLPKGDQSIIGSQGIALSGGQSQRIALARAIYAQREVLILDDALTGLDASTENRVFHNLLGTNGLLRESRATVLMTSSSVKRVPYADHVVSLDSSGKISEQGKFNKLNDTGGYVSTFFLPLADWSYVSEAEEERAKTEVEASAMEVAESIQQDIEVEANRRTGDVAIYLYYIGSVGWWPATVFVVAISGFIFCLSFPNIWVKWWAAANVVDPNGRLGYWLGIYGGLGCLAIVCLFISCWQMIVKMVPASGEKFHFALLETVLSAPMSFFASTDIGVTINRFSQDLQLIDMELPIAALNTFATLVLCIAQVALIGIASYYAVASFPIVLLALYFIQKFYLRTSRQLRFMDLEAKAPLYSLFSESLSGLATIRAFGWQTALEERNRLLLDSSQQPFYLLYSVQRWLTLVLDLVVAAIAALLIILVVKLRGSVSAGYVGVALLNIIMFSQSIKLLITFWTTLETHIGAVARVKIFSETVASEDLPSESSTPPPSWPSEGGIEFSHISAAYKSSDMVLKDISLSIQAGEKIGVCGRTGSGKTSLVLSIFRMLEMKGGTITIDGVDLSTIPRQEIRSRVVGVSQDAFLLKGSVRLNADPTGAASDEEISEALRSVQLFAIVEEKGGLDADIDDIHLSNGQRQLFCLARAMLRPSTILVLDEATSNIDGKTEEIMQRLIRKKFASHTIIAVAHKLETILDFDKVAVLEGGELIEFDDPYALLSDPESSFSLLYNNTMAEQVEDVMVESDIMSPRTVLSRLSTKDTKDSDLFPQD